jgi:glycosyltransferase involved in cell wall biosynthesis
MRILEITKSYYPNVGGLEKFVFDRRKIYDSLGIGSLILTSDIQLAKQNSDMCENDVRKVHCYTPYFFSTGLKGTLLEKYDLMMVNMTGRFISDYSIYYGKKLGRKVVLTPHMSFHTKKFQIIKYTYSELIIKRLLKLVDGVVCFTEYEKEFWFSHFGCSKDKLYVIPHFFEKNDVIVSNNRKSDYLLYLGRPARNKRTDLLIEAFAKMESTDISLVMTIEKEDLPLRIRNLVEEDSRIKLIGYVSEIKKHELLCNTKAVVFPTEYEAFGSVLLEASSYSKPILCSELPIFREIMDNKGIIYFRNDIEEINGAIKKLLNMKEEAIKNMGEINKNNLERYKFENVCNLYANMFNEIMRK